MVTRFIFVHSSTFISVSLNIDPAIIGYLLEHTGFKIEEINEILNKDSGLKGICGLNDLRDIHEQAAGRPPSPLTCFLIR